MTASYENTVTKPTLSVNATVPPQSAYDAVRSLDSSENLSRDHECPSPPGDPRGQHHATSGYPHPGCRFGLLGAVGLFAVRAWLPRRSVLAGLTVAGIGAALLARPTELLDPDSSDFEILGPVWFAVTFAVGLIVLLGAVTAVLADRWVDRWPSPAWTIRGVCGLLPLVPLLLLGPGVVIIPALVLFRVLVWPRSAAEPATRVGIAASGVVLAAGIAGWAWTLVVSAQILA